jgi:hypothetical protein
MERSVARLAVTRFGSRADPAASSRPSAPIRAAAFHHSCGTVPPHGAAELAHPEPDLYIAGMKSYGRAPTFLMLTGYEQVRSIAAALAGDQTAAQSIELVLPPTHVCSGQSDESAGCCDTAAPIDPIDLIIPIASLTRPR